MTDVPPGTYKLVVWHPYIRTTIEQTVTIAPKGTTEANIVVSAPTGRLYANEVLDHPYTRYNVTEETKKEIDPMIQNRIAETGSLSNPNGQSSFEHEASSPVAF